MLIIAGIALLIAVFGYIYSEITDVYHGGIGGPLFFGGSALLITFLILVFLPNSFYKAWKDFAIWYIPIAAIWIAMTDPYGWGGGIFGFGLATIFDEGRIAILRLLTSLYGIIFTIIILVKSAIIMWKYIRDKKKKIYL